MDDPSELINKFCTEADAARDELRSTQGISVDAVTLQSVLTERLGLSNSVFLIDQNLDKKRILEIVAGHNFKSLVATVEMDSDILPDSVLRLVTEAEVTVKNQIWRIHKGDADYFPSDPHAHNVETNTQPSHRIFEKSAGTICLALPHGRDE